MKESVALQMNAKMGEGSEFFTVKCISQPKFFLYLFDGYFFFILSIFFNLGRFS